MTRTIEDKSGRLRVLRGEAQSLGPSRANLEILPLRTAPNGEQIVLPYMRPSRSCIISAPIECLASHRIDRLIKDLTPRIVIDIRLSPSFERLGTSRPKFLSHLRSHGVDYAQIANLGNRFVGEGHDSLIRFRQLLRNERADDLRDLRQSVDVGPVVLTSVHRKHTGSDREVIVELLHDARMGFELLILE